MTFAEYADRLRLAGTKRLQAAMHTEMATTVEDAIGRTQERLGGAVLRVRSGNLRRSITGVTEMENGPVAIGKVRAGGGQRDVRYARIHELGGVITPNGNSGGGGKFLAIPTSMAPGGQTKHTARDVPGLRFQPIRGGSMGLLVRDNPGAKRGGRGARSDILYILVRRVTMPARPYLRPSVMEANAGLADRMRQAMNQLMVTT